MLWDQLWARAVAVELPRANGRIIVARRRGGGKPRYCNTIKNDSMPRDDQDGA